MDDEELIEGPYIPDIPPQIEPEIRRQVMEHVMNMLENGIEEVGAVAPIEEPEEPARPIRRRRGVGVNNRVQDLADQINETVDRIVEEERAGQAYAINPFARFANIEPAVTWTVSPQYTTTTSAPKKQSLAKSEDIDKMFS